MSALMLIHPNPRKRRKSGKRRSAAQRAATARMLAANRASRGGGTRKRKYKRRAKAASAAPARSYRRAKRYARRAARRGASFLRGFSVGSVVPMVKNAGIGATGALAADVGYGFASRFLPEQVQSPANGLPYYAAKGAFAILGGIVLGKVISPSLASKMAEGSLIVSMHGAAKTLLPADLLPMGSMGYQSSAMVARGNVRRIAEYVGRPTGSNGRGALRANGAMTREMGEYVRR